MISDDFIAHNYDFWLIFAVATDPADAGEGTFTECAGYVAVRDGSVAVIV